MRLNISMKKPNAIIVGGTGQFGIILSKELLKKKIRVTITTRSVKKAKKKLINKKFNLKKLNVLNTTEIVRWATQYISCAASKGSQQIILKIHI